MTHPIYHAISSAESLAQGDILLAQALHLSLLGHQDYVANQPHFRHFVVLTQSCDLDRSRREVADFVTLSVVRHMKEAIGRRQVDSRGALRELLRDLFQHQYNKRGFFYLPESSQHSIEVDSVIDLRVVFSVHREHYDALLAARQAAMNPVYAAQLGSIFGHMFNRVAVAGWSDTGATTELKAHVKSVLTDFEATESARLDELLRTYHGRCTIAGCDQTATTYRWIRVKPAYELISQMQCLLCRPHAEAYDRNCLPRDTQLAWDEPSREAEV